MFPEMADQILPQVFKAWIFKNPKPHIRRLMFYFINVFLHL